MEFLESKGGRELAISALARATQIFLKVQFSASFVFKLVNMLIQSYCEKGSLTSGNLLGSVSRH